MISYSSRPRRTATVPNAFSYAASGKTASVSSGSASVARSQSLAGWPRTVSRSDVYSLFTPYLADERNEAWRTYLFLGRN